MRRLLLAPEPVRDAPPDTPDRPVRSTKTQRCTAGRVQVRPRLALVWHGLAVVQWAQSNTASRELWRGLTEVTPDGLAREVRWSARWGPVLNLRRLAESGEQAVQAPGAGQEGLELHGAVAARAAQIHGERPPQKLAPRSPSTATFVGARRLVLRARRVVGVTVGVGLHVRRDGGQRWDQQGAPVGRWGQHPLCSEQC